MSDELPLLLERIRARHTFAELPPWHPRDEDGIERELLGVANGLAAYLNAEVLIERNHYGSGYASFVEAFFFRRDDAHLVDRTPNRFAGLVVLFCRHAPFHCVLEGERWWSGPDVSSASLPCCEGVDALVTDAVRGLWRRAQPWLEERGYVRLVHSMLAAPLPDGTVIPTNLGPGTREFDVLFHWED